MARNAAEVAPSTAGTAPAKRLSLSQIVEVLLAKRGGEHSAVTLTRNAKGETQIEVVVRTGESDEVATVDDAAVAARRLYDELRVHYPYGEAPPAA